MKRFFNKEQCTGCGNCISSCPEKLLQLSSDVNQKNNHYIEMKQGKCLECRRCAIMCTAAATWFAIEEKEPEEIGLMKKDELPDHHGCALGILSRLLAEVICELGIREKTVFFKSPKAEINLYCDTMSYPAPEYFKEALIYKKKNPQKNVIVILSDAKPPMHSMACEILTQLKDEKITVIHTLDYFTQEDDYTACGEGATHLLEQLAQKHSGSYLARGSVTTPRNTLGLKKYIKTALQYQMQGRCFSIVEIIYPCYYRLEGRPKEQISYKRLKLVQSWFEEHIEQEFLTGVIYQEEPHV